MRTLLINNISEIFRNDGMTGLTMDKLSKELSISKKTLYKEFSSKENLIQQVLLYELQKEFVRTEAICNKYTSPIKQMLVIQKYSLKISSIFRTETNCFLNDHYKEILDFLLNKRAEFFAKLFWQNIIDGINDKFYFESVDKDLTTFFLQSYDYQFRKLLLNKTFTVSGKEYEKLTKLWINYLQKIITSKGKLELDKYWANSKQTKRKKRTCI